MDDLRMAVSETPPANEEMLPFALAQPSRAVHAVVFPQRLEPRAEKVRAFFAERGMVLSDEEGTISLPGPTFSMETTQVDTPVQSTFTLTIPPDTTPDSQSDPVFDSKEDDVSAPD